MNNPIKEFRTKKRIVLVDASIALGISIASLSRIERGLQGVTPDLARRIEIWSAGQISRMELLYPDDFLRAENS